VTGGRNGVFFILENGDEERVTMNSFATTEDLYCHVLFKINLGPFKLFSKRKLIIPSKLTII